MNIFIKPNGRGSSSFYSCFKTKRLEIKGVNGFTKSDDCKKVFFSAVCDKTSLHSSVKDRLITLDIDRIERSNKNNEILFFGRAKYLQGLGFNYVNISGKVKF